MALCEAHAGTVYRFARMVSRSDSEAEDIAHDSLVRVIRSAHRFDATRGDIGAWLWKLVINTARDHRRISTRAGVLLSQLATARQTEPAQDPSDLAVRSLGDDELIRAIRSLPKKYRSVIALRYGADLPFADVAGYLGLSEGATRMAHMRALTLLRQELSKE
jgi:RNA polymerase sigma-70 factor (ECF subfamily)